MNAFTSESSPTFKRQSYKLLQSAVCLTALSTLFACSQPDASASAASALQNDKGTAVTANVAESNVTESNAQTAPLISTTASNPDLLKNVSATVYKDANCGCCKDWISHAEDNGLSATAQDVTDLAVFKERYGVPAEMRSCHTAVTTDGYVFEGHVPAKYVAQFLENPPVQALGLAVPGMPVGSPGMEYQNKFAPYQIMQLNKDGTTEVYADIVSTEQQL
ncbi:MAG: DUF411 domain-containing protein [Psychrobacter sp.]|nr:DUF411 domain-containing protein [Psychrobacter sp.]